MSEFRIWINAAYQIFQIPLSIGDYTFTFFQVLLFFGVSGALIRLLYGIFE